MKKRKIIAFFQVALLSAIMLAQAQVPEGWAVVSGQVLDAKGVPVPEAGISLFPAAAFSGALPYATTDKNGFYRLASPPFGKAWLCAVKPGSGYPDTNSLLFAPEKDDRPEIFLAPGSELDQDIHLAPPDGILEAHIIDAVTKSTVPDGRIMMRRHNPEAFYSKTISRDGHFLYALPAVPIEVNVSAPGYRPWRYRDPKTGTENLTLSSSDHRVMTIELVPIGSKR